jgi:hypothetical protein
MTPRPFAGIDPGVTGALALVDAEGRFQAVHDMPTTLATTGRRQIDPGALAALLREHGPAFCLVERVGPRPREGAVGAFSFGLTFGAILGVLATLGLPHDLVQPVAWKRRAGIPPKSPKGVSIAVAKRLLPDAGPHLTLVKHDGRAEALLLALQSRERWARGQPESIQAVDLPDAREVFAALPGALEAFAALPDVREAFAGLPGLEAFGHLPDVEQAFPDLMDARELLPPPASDGRGADS